MIPNWLQAIVLGIVQGLSEFIPVSSSGHLVLTPYLLGWERPGLAFDVALHGGTAGAIVVFFRRELWAMLRGVLQGSKAPDGLLYRRLAILLVIGSVPVAIVGLTLEDVVADAFESPLITSFFLFATGAILVGGERWRDRRVRRTRQTAAATAAVAEAVWDGDWVGPDPGPAADPRIDLPRGEDAADPAGRTLDRIGVRDALLIGVAQTLALFPGVSRSGTTIMAGVVTGLTREAATRFSFLLALPALVGAGILSLPDLAEPDIYSGPEIVGGVIAAFASGYIAIKLLVALVSRERLTGFAVYVAAVGVIGILGYLMLGPTSAV